MEKVRAVKAFHRARTALIAAGVSLLLGAGACGRVGHVSGKDALAHDKDAYPTLDNFSRWRPTWNKNSWIVAFKDGASAKPSAQDFKRRFAQALLGTSGLFDGDAAHARLEGFLDARLNVELVRMKHFWGELEGARELGLGFALVTLKNAQDIWPTIADSVVLPAGLDPSEPFSGIAAWQMSTLQSTEDAVWVEPNLMSKLYDVRGGGGGSGSGSGGEGADTEAPLRPRPLAGANPPPEFKTNASIVDVLKRIKADKAYELNADKRASDVNVAVLDTGVDAAHPDLKNRIFKNPNEKAGDKQDNDGNCYVDDVEGIDATYECGRDESAEPRPGSNDLGGPGKACPNPEEGDELSANCGHGTHVAGIIAAEHGGDLATLGVCPTCKVMSLRVSERCIQPQTMQAGECVRPEGTIGPDQYEVDGGIADSSQIRALTYLFNLRAPNRPDQLLVNVVNMSLGKYFRSRAMAYIIRNLQKKNIIVVAAAGNDNTDTPSYPAAYSSVVSVCATSEEYSNGDYGKAMFSNFGDWVDICAPGEDIVSTVPGADSSKSGNTVEKSGTSQATPFVAGAIGYMLSLSNNTKSALQIIREVQEAADYDSLYNAEFNKGLFTACYPKSDVCDHLLGTGMLDLLAAVKSEKKTKVESTDPKGVTEGCIVSSVTARTGAARWNVFSSVPFLLAQFWCVLVLVRKARGLLARGKR